MPRIESVLSCLVTIPLETPTSFSTRTVTERQYVLVRVRADDGVEGEGFCYAGNQAGGLALDAVRTMLAPLLHGEDPYRVAGLWEKMYQESLLHGRAGVILRAISALDIALWDRNARAAGLPLYKFLGACRTDAVPAYASVKI